MTRWIPALCIALAACGGNDIPIGPEIDFTGTYCLSNLNGEPPPFEWNGSQVVGGAVYLTRPEGTALRYDDELELFDDGGGATSASLTRGPGTAVFETSRTLLLGNARAEIRADSLVLTVLSEQENRWAYQKRPTSTPCW